MTAEPGSITLSLISHTNAGKTTLARTLLGRDVGEVRDAAHVTLEATRYSMLESSDGEMLALWDTPGFGDSARLARRLAQQGNPIGWLLSHVWDRFRDRPLWLAQQAVRNVRDHADVVLYLVNASEDPADAGYVAPELQVLAWIGKPVIALLNQTGRPRPTEQEAAEAMRWRQALAGQGFIRTLLPLDAFARCWAQEITLLREVAAAVPEEKRALADRLAAAWQASRWAQFQAAMATLVQPIARAACERITLPEAALPGTLRRLGKAIGIHRDADVESVQAMQVLADLLEAELQESTNELIRIHGIAGRATAEVLARLASDVTAREPMHEGKAALLGGVVSGALSGLAADLALGGLTFGAGMLAGGLLGALGGAGFARGYNVVRGRKDTLVQWSEAFLDAMVDAALLRYLAVAHYGRGRGEWMESEYPPFWRDVVTRATAARRGSFASAWEARATGDVALVERHLRAPMEAAALEVLNELYPGALAQHIKTSLGG